MDKKQSRMKRALKLRSQIKKLGATRLSIHKTSQHIYAQVIDDTRGHTLATASTLDAEIAGDSKGKKKTGKAEMVGALLAKRAIDKGISQVAFDRGGSRYHGRVKALAEAARKGGLKF